MKQGKVHKSVSWAAGPPQRMKIAATKNQSLTASAILPEVGELNRISSLLPRGSFAPFAPWNTGG